MSDRIEQLEKIRECIRNAQAELMTNKAHWLLDEASELVDVIEAFAPVVVCRDAKPPPLGLTLQVGKQKYLSIVDRDKKIVAEGLATVECADISVDKDDFTMHCDPRGPARYAQYRQIADIRVRFDTLCLRELTPRSSAQGEVE